MQAACGRFFWNYDYRPLARQLGLLEKNYDKLSSADGPVVRVSDDQLIPYIVQPDQDSNLIPLYDSQSRLIEYDMAYRDGQVYTVKIFKFISSPGIFCFLFRREKPGFGFPNGKAADYDADIKTVYDTDIKTVLANRDYPMA